MAGIPLPALDTQGPTPQSTMAQYGGLIRLKMLADANQAQVQGQNLSNQRSALGIQQQKALMNAFGIQTPGAGTSPQQPAQAVQPVPGVSQTPQPTQGAQAQTAASGPDIDSLKDRLIKAGPAGISLVKNLDDIQTAQETARSLAEKNSASESDLLGSVGQLWLKNNGDPATIQNSLNYVSSIAPQYAGQVAQISKALATNPQAWKGLATQFVGISAKQQALNTAAEASGARMTQAEKPTTATLAMSAQEVGADGKPTATALKAQKALLALKNTSGARISAIAPEIQAQLGPMPTTSTFGGKDFGSVAAAQAAWGREVEGVKNSEGAASGVAHGEGFETMRPQPIYDSTGARTLGEWIPGTGQVLRAPGVSVAQIQGAMQSSGLNPKATSSMLTMGQMGSTLVPIHNTIDSQIDRLTKQVGPAIGRWNQLMVNKGGKNFPAFAGLDQSLRLYATGVAKAHFGGRAPEGIVNALFKDFGEAQSPADLKSRIAAANDFMVTYAHAAGLNQAAPATQSAAQTGFTQTATGPGGHKIGLLNGKWVDAQTGAPVK